MLGKLIKHEWKSSYKVGCMMLLGILLVTFFGWLSFQAPLWQAAVNNTYYDKFSVWDMLSMMTLLMYVLMLVGLNYGIIIYMGVRFYKTMYTDEGYLTHTLPVTKHQILISKTLNSGLWVLFVILGVYLSVGVLGISLIGAFLPEGYTFSDVWSELSPYWGEIERSFREMMGTGIGGYFAMLMILSLIAPFTSVMILFGAISIGQLFTKHRVLMAIVTYVGLMIVESLISSTIQSVISMKQMSRLVSDSQLVGGYLNVSMLSSVIISVIMAVILYVVSYYVTSKKLNME